MYFGTLARTARRASVEPADDAQRLAHLLHPHQVPVVVCAVLAERHVELELS
jgi:hypothetical protein